METQTADLIEVVHPWERDGLGKAPFKLLGEVHQDVTGDGMRVIGSVGGCRIETKPGGTCAVCGQYILAMFNIESADGNRFHVGSDCVTKVGTASPKLVAKVKKIVAAKAKARKDARELYLIAVARVALPHVRPSLAALPHPSALLAGRGATLADYVEYLSQFGGRTGKVKAARLILDAAK